MKPIEIKKDIHWVGAIDFDSRDFHGYSLSPRGTTYNAYVIRDEKNVLFDTVKHGFGDVLLCRLAHVIEPEKIDYIVVNHVEMDHSGELPRLVAACRPETIFCSPMGEKSMRAHFDCAGWPIKVVKSGESISIGKRSIHFLETRMLHWPDSMFSYIPEDKLVICNDAFGQNIASTERFADEMEQAVIHHAMVEYYHNIVLPYSQQVLKVLGQIREMKLDIEMIAPDHGLIFRGKEAVQYALDTYQEFAEQKTRKRAVIVYDTMWHSTEKMADAIAGGLLEAGVPVRLMHLKQNHHSAVMTEVARCGLVVVGSPTHNNGILPSVAGMLSYMKGLRPQNRLGAAFGSYGWSGECVKIISDWLTQMDLEQPCPPLKTQFVPKHEALKEYYQMGKDLGQALIAKCWK